MKNAVKTVDEYIEMQAPAFRKQLQKIRSIIKTEVPAAKEMMSYGVPCYHYYYMLIAFGATKKHCSLYAMSLPLLKQLKADTEGLRIKGSTLHFEPDEQLPEELIRKAIVLRVKQNEERAATKKNLQKN